jgi:septal ring factor EnvC (AmiA/AmiB activator)
VTEMYNLKSYYTCVKHNRKLIAALSRELKEKDSQIQELRQNIVSLENKLEELAVKTKREL